MIAAGARRAGGRRPRRAGSGRGRHVEAADDVHQRRLARAGRAHDRDVVAALDRQVDAGEGVHDRARPAVGLGDRLHVDHMAPLDRAGSRSSVTAYLRGRGRRPPPGKVKPLLARGLLGHDDHVAGGEPAEDLGLAVSLQTGRHAHRAGSSRPVRCTVAVVWFPIVVNAELDTRSTPCLEPVVITTWEVCPSLTPVVPSQRDGHAVLDHVVGDGLDGVDAGHRSRSAAGRWRTG